MYTRFVWFLSILEQKDLDKIVLVRIWKSFKLYPRISWGTWCIKTWMYCIMYLGVCFEPIGERKFLIDLEFFHTKEWDLNILGPEPGREGVRVILYFLLKMWCDIIYTMYIVRVYILDFNVTLNKSINVHYFLLFQNGPRSNVCLRFDFRGWISESLLFSWIFRNSDISS